MKLATCLLAGALLGFPALLSAADPAGASQTVISFTGGSVWNADYSGGTCVWYLPIVGDLGPDSLFSDPTNPAKETAYLVWVSEFTVQMLPAAPPFLPAPANPSVAPPYALVLANSGTGTIYYQSAPAKRVWPVASGSSTLTPDDLKKVDWGVPVATFNRNASIVRSADGLKSDNFTFSADLLDSATFVLPDGVMFNFHKLIPHGMTCVEFGQQMSSWESGTCLATGK